MRLNREQRTKLLDFCEELCNTSCLSNKTLGMTIRSYHLACPFVVLIVLCYGSQWWVTANAFSLMFVFFTYFICNGCLLTMLEHRLCGDEFTIADLFIEVLQMEMNTRNRMIVSYCIAISYFAFFFLVYYYRFYYKSATIIPNLIPNII